MSIFDSFKFFVRNGARVFSLAAHGEYEYTSARVEKLRYEMNTQPDGPAMDKLKLRQDRKKIYRDASLALEEYKSKTSK